MEKIKLEVTRGKSFVGAAMPYRLVINGCEIAKYMHNSYKREQIFIITCFISFILSACGSSSQKKSNTEASLLNILEEETIDIPISVNLVHTDDEYLEQFHPAEYEVIYKNDNEIHIDIDMTYYKNYVSGQRFTAMQNALLSTKELEYLTLNLDIVNNTNILIDVNELDIYVDKSELDTIPFVYIQTTEDRSNSISFINGSWFNWHSFMLSYKLLKYGEKFDGKYTNRKYIPFFEDYITVDLLEDMKELGYDFDGLAKCGEISYTNEDLDPNHPFYNDNSYCLLLGVTEEEKEIYQQKFSPFGLKEDIFEGEYIGVATLYGSIEFEEPYYKVDFVADIPLSTSGGFGAVSYENDHFDVNLKSSGDNYILRYPYTTIIEPYGAEMVKLVIAADKSSTHKFHIDCKNGNDLIIRSKDIYFHHFFPKDCDKWW